jgi:demethylmenaquinone methyltransferase/2-methoxy-6-polyprenyl-1,4-benzoquinol methylase
MMGTGSTDISPVNRPLTKAGEYYTRLAPWYDFLAGSEKKFIRLGLDLLNPQPGEKILEIGFGTGYAQGQIIPALENGYSVGIDLSPGMIFIAQRKLNKAGIARHANLLCSDSLPLPLQSDQFHAVFTSFTLELFDTPQIPMVLGECRRVLKPGGRLVVVSLSKDQPLGAMGQLYEAIHDRFPTIADCRPIPVRHLLDENGFTVSINQTKKMWGLPVSLTVAHL